MGSSMTRHAENGNKFFFSADCTCPTHNQAWYLHHLLKVFVANSPQSLALAKRGCSLQASSLSGEQRKAGA